MDVQQDTTNVVKAMFSRDAENPSVCVADGYGVTVTTSSGRLVVDDGIGRHRRKRTYTRATHGLSRLVILAHSGNLSFEAIKWLEGAGVSWVMLDPFSGEVISESSRVLNNDARLRRAQAVSAGTETGLSIARFLTQAKLKGQARIAVQELNAPKITASIMQLHDRVDDVGSLEEIRQLEASAANLYWSAWSSIEIRFVKSDLPRVPENWKVFEGRRSAVMVGTSRNATDPVNALLNYSYRLVEAEGRLATLAVGLDPSLGILHADMKGRASFVLDLIEAARPIAEEHVLQLVRKNPFRWRDFDEDSRGVVRLLSPLTHRLGEAMPSYGLELAPVVNGVVKILTNASPYDFSVPSVLQEKKHREVARQQVAAAHTKEKASSISLNQPGMKPRRKSRQKPTEKLQSPLPLPICKECGVLLGKEAERTRRRGDFCPVCLATRRVEIGKMIQSTPKKKHEMRPETKALRAVKNAATRFEQKKWEEDHAGEIFDGKWFLCEITPKLAAKSLTEIARLTGLSTSAASQIRSGKRVPHPRHWEKFDTFGPDT